MTSFVPHNLSSVAPADSTTAAVAELPVLNARSPAPLLQSSLPNASHDFAPPREVKDTISSMIAENAAQGSWEFTADEISLNDGDAPRWVTETCNTLGGILAGSSDIHAVKGRGKKPNGKRPRPSDNLNASPSSLSRSARRHRKAARLENGDVTPSHSRMEVDEVDDDDETQIQRELTGARALNEFDEDKFNKFVRYLEQFVERAGDDASTFSDTALRMTDSENRVRALLDKLAVHEEDEYLHRVPNEILSKLMAALAHRVRHSVDTTKKGKSIDASAVSTALLTVYCVGVIFRIYNAPKVHGTVLLEDVLEVSVSFIESLFNSLIYPCCLLGKDKDADSDDDDQPTTSVSSRIVQKLIAMSSTLMDLFFPLVLRRQASEVLVLQVLSSGLRSLRIVELRILHPSIIRLAAATYAHYSTLHSAVLNFVVDEIASIPPTKRQMRTFLVSGSVTRNVRVSSAMALTIIQYASNLDESASDAEAAVKGYKGSNVFALNLASRVLSKLYPLKKDTEYRDALFAFLDDVFSLFVEPEWPSAYVLMQHVSLEIINSIESETKMEQFARSAIVDVLGKLCSRITSAFGAQLLCGGEKIIQLDNASNSELRVLQFLHGVGSNSTHEQSAAALWRAMFSVGDWRTAKRVVLNDSGNGDAEENGNIEVDEESNKKIVALARNRFRERIRALSDSLKNRGKPGRVNCVDAVKHVVVNSGIVDYFQRILDAILICLGDKAPTVRAKTIKALAQIQVDKNLIRRRLPSIIEACEDSCLDTSPSVRDAALDFLGGFLTLGNADMCSSSQAEGKAVQKQGASFFAKVYHVVKLRLCDKKVLVRKRAIGIFRNLVEELLALKDLDDGTSTFDQDFSLSAQEQQVVDICACLVSRLDDPETSVRDIAEKTVRYALFAIDAKNQMKTNSQEEYALRSVRRLIFLFRNLATGPAVNLFSRLLTANVVNVHREALEKIIGTVVDYFHDVENRMARDGTSASIDKQQIYDMLRVSCTSVLLSFGVMNRTLIAPHCSSLAVRVSDVKLTSHSDMICTKRILRLLELGIPQTNDIQTASLANILSDIETLVCLDPSEDLEENAVRSLCAVARHINSVKSNGVICSTAKTFYQFLIEKMNVLLANYRQQMDKDTISVVRNGKRALIRMSLLIRHGEHDEIFIRSVFDILKTVCQGLLDNWDVTDFDRLSSPPLLREAALALMNFLIRHRHFLPRGTNLILRCTSLSLNKIAASGKEDAITLDLLRSILQGFHEMLRNEEERNSNPLGDRGESEAVATANGSTPRLAAEADAEAGYLTGCAQELLPSLSEALSSDDSKVRKCIVSIYGLLIRQGLVLPAKLVSPLFTLLTDSDPGIREDSQRCLTFVAERYAGMMASAIPGAIRDCYRRTAETWKGLDEEGPFKCIQTAIFDEKSGLANVAPVFVMLNKEQRLGILIGLLQLFDPCLVARKKRGESVIVLDDADSEKNRSKEEQFELVVFNHHETKKSEPISFLVYVAMLLAHLDYSLGAGAGGTSAAETKLRNGRLELGELVDFATRIVSNSGQALFRVAVPMMKRDDFDLKKFSEMAYYASGLSILMQLKSYLRSLRSHKPQQKVLTEEEEDSSASAPRKPSFSISGMNITQGPLCEDPLGPVASPPDQVQQLKFFRKLMRNDASDLLCRAEDETANCTSRSAKRRRGRRKNR